MGFGSRHLETGERGTKVKEYIFLNVAINVLLGFQEFLSLWCSTLFIYFFSGFWLFLAAVVADFFLVLDCCGGSCFWWWVGMVVAVVVVRCCSGGGLVGVSLSRSDCSIGIFFFFFTVFRSSYCVLVSLFWSVE